MNNLNLNVNEYTKNELLDIAGLEYNSNEEEINSKFSKLIKSKLNENNYEIAQFLHNAKNKLLEEKDDSNENESNEDESNENESNENNDNEIQAEQWLKNLYRKPITEGQNYKITDRENTVTTFNSGSRPVMTRARLGINTSTFSKFTQDSLNPTFSQTITKKICIRSTDRSLIVPFTTEYLPKYNNPFRIDESPSNFVVSLNETLHNVLSLKVESVSMSHSFYTFDKFYSSNYFYVYTCSNEDFLTTDLSFSCSKIYISSGTYSSGVDLVSQINLDLSNCVNNYLKDGSNNLLLTANVYDILTNDPKILFINSSNLYVKLLFYNKDIKNGNNFNSGLYANEDCSKCNNFFVENSSFYQQAEYTNNMGYNLGFRLEYEEWKQNIFDNSNNSSYDPSGVLYLTNNSQFKLSQIRDKYFLDTLDFNLSRTLNPCNSSNITTTLESINYKLLYWDISYNKYLYNEDINNVYFQLVNDNNSCYTISNVGYSLITTGDIFICIDDYQNNKSLNKLIFPNNTLIDVLGTISLGLNNLLVISNVKSIPREYFGPVKIDKLGIKLVDQRGNLVNLNGKDWVLNLSCEELYQY